MGIDAPPPRKRRTPHSNTIDLGERRRNDPHEEELDFNYDGGDDGEGDGWDNNPVTPRPNRPRAVATFYRED
ncbi:hypothetical protein V5O48_019705, partial [Marasmius crinis-equi]